jgi:RTX calcium-binding nonapeptide repeat (4 copies)
LRRFARITVVSMLVILLAAGLASAKTFTCTTVNCYGTDNPDTITGTSKDQNFYGYRGDDQLYDQSGNDTDVLNGNVGDDRLNDADGDGRDTINGGNGYDVCIGDRNDTFKNCEVERIR